MKNLASILVSLFLLVALTAPVGASNYNDDRSMTELMGIKMYTNMLNKHASRGDEWSKLRLDEVEKGLEVMDMTKKYQETSWWNPITKGSTLVKSWVGEKTYHNAAKERREYEKELARYGQTSTGKSAENLQRAGVKLAGWLGISQTAKEGTKLIEQIDRAEDKAFEYGETNGLFHPIKKIKLLTELMDQSKDVQDQRKRVEEAAKGDPIVQIATIFSDVKNVFSGIFGKNDNNGRISSNNKKEAKPGFFDKLFGDNKIQKKSAAEKYRENQKFLGSRIEKDINDIGSSFADLGRELDNLGRSLDTAFADFGKSINQPTTTCVNGNCKPQPKLNTLLNRLNKKIE